MQVYETTMKGGITRSKEFERKKLAAFAVNVGTKCGHGCHYPTGLTPARAQDIRKDGAGIIWLGKE